MMLARLPRPLAPAGPGQLPPVGAGSGMPVLEPGSALLPLMLPVWPHVPWWPLKLLAGLQGGCASACSTQADLGPGVLVCGLSTAPSNSTACMALARWGCGCGCGGAPLLPLEPEVQAAPAAQCGPGPWPPSADGGSLRSMMPAAPGSGQTAVRKGCMHECACHRV